MTSDKRYAPELTVGPTTPLEIRAIYDNKEYRVETRECGRMVKVVSGGFIEKDGRERKNASFKISRLNEVVADSITEVVALGSGNLEDYTIHLSIQPVLDVTNPNVITEVKYEPRKRKG